MRDLADLHIRAMTAPNAAGQRFLATGDFMWMKDIAGTLRARLGASARVRPRDAGCRGAAWVVFIPQLRMLTRDLGRMNRCTSEKARRLLGFSPRPAATTIVDCAESLLASRVAPQREA